MKSKILIFLCFFTAQIFAQTILGVDTLVKSGPLDKRINLVIISEGFTASEMSIFNSKATFLSNYFFNSPPYKNYKKYFNVFAVRCASPNSGVSHPGTATDVNEPIIPVVSVVNSFNTTFDNNHTHRAIVSNNATAVYSVLAQSFPNYDQAVILANSPEYGGTGGPYAVLSINSAAPETFIHELGHSFAGLADEYWAGAGFAVEKPNMTMDSNSVTAKWSQWIGLNGIGLYPYDTFTPASNWYRPHQNCKMRVLNVPYCSVCQQTVIERIHSLTNPIDKYWPSDTIPLAYTDTTVWFKTKLIKPIPNTLKSTWEINSDLFASNVDSIGVSGTLFAQGDNSVIYTVIDTTILSKDPNHASLHTYSIVWDLNYYSTVGIKDIKPRIEFSIFPNPASDIVYLNYNLLKNSEVSVMITDMSGRILISEKSKETSAGEYKKEINVSGLSQGNYILALKINDQIINNKIVIFR